MSDRADAWMPLYIADYLRDTQHLSTQEHGAYFLLLMYAWTNGGSLPLDERRLARIAGLEQREWKRSGPVVLEFFDKQEQCFRHKRVDEEMAKAQAKLEQQRAAGRASAQQRALQREAQRNGNGRSTGVATGKATDAQREAQRTGQRKGNPSPSPISSLRSDTPKPPREGSDENDRFAGQPEPVRRVLEAGRFTSVPPDVGLIAEWLALPNMDLDRDVIPLVERITGETMATSGRVPFRCKFFDQRIRDQHAADEAEAERLRSVSKRYGGASA